MIANLLRRDPLRLKQMKNCARDIPPLCVRSRKLDQQRRPSLEEVVGHGTEVDLSREALSFTGVAQLHRHRHAMNSHVRWPERDA